MNDQVRKPIPLNLDWTSPEGKAHMLTMAKLPPDHPVAQAHAENLQGADAGMFKQLQDAIRQDAEEARKKSEDRVNEILAAAEANKAADEA